MKEINALFESFKPQTQALITFFTWLFGNLNTVTAFVALVVIVYQLRVAYYTGKLRKLECEEKERKKDK